MRPAMEAAQRPNGKPATSPKLTEKESSAGMRRRATLMALLMARARQPRARHASRASAGGSLIQKKLESSEISARPCDPTTSSVAIVPSFSAPVHCSLPYTYPSARRSEPCKTASCRGVATLQWVETACPSMSKNEPVLPLSSQPSSPSAPRRPLTHQRRPRSDLLST